MFFPASESPHSLLLLRQSAWWYSGVRSRMPEAIPLAMLEQTLYNIIQRACTSLAGLEVAMKQQSRSGSEEKMDRREKFVSFT